MIAEVIIDLKAKSVDRTYSYKVPDEFLGVIEVGERCFVEFSNFKRMGIIVSLSETEDPSIKYKEIIVDYLKKRYKNKKFLCHNDLNN